MKKSFIILLFHCLVATATSQEWINDKDSVKQLLVTEKEDTVKVFRLANLCALYIYNNPDSALKYCNLMLELSRKLNYNSGTAEAHVMLSDIDIILGNYSRAMYNVFEAVKIYRQAGDTLHVINMNGKLAGIYYELGDYKQSLAYRNIVIRATEALPDTFYMGGTMELKKEQMMYLSAAAAGEYLLGNILDSALFFARKAFTIDRELGRFWSYSPLILGNVYLKMNEPDSALKYYRSVIRIPAQNDAVDINVGLATVFQKVNALDSSRYYAKMALDSALEIRYLKAIMNASALLSDLNEKSNPSEAIRYYKISINAKDSLYNREKMNEVSTLISGEERRLRELQEAELNYSNKLRMIALLTLTVIFLIIGIFLYRNNLHRKKAYLLLSEQKKQTDFQKGKAESALEELRSTQAQLIQSEKMASLGELTAGIAHEIQNPLNFVNNFSDVNQELLEEMKEKIRSRDFEEVENIVEDIKANEVLINLHGKRADGIVKSMLQHSHNNTGKKELIDINKLVDEYLRLAYHGQRSKDKNFNVTLKTDFDNSIGDVSVVPQDIGRVLLNLYNNALYSVSAFAKVTAENSARSAVEVVAKAESKQLSGTSQDQSATADTANERIKTAADYEPTLWVNTKKNGNSIEITVRDNGNGIPEKIVDKIFQPFFTTKPTGQGTGLGLSLVYDIVKAHGGEINVKNYAGNGAEFIISLPVA